MSTWRVFVRSWQIECCGTPPAVGDVVYWQLAWSDPVSTGELAVTMQEFAVVGPGFPPADKRAEPAGTVLRSGPVTAWWNHPTPPVDTITLRGFLHEDHHGDVPEEVPATHGVVRRVEVATATYARAAQDSLSWLPVAGTGRLRSVRTSPSRFACDDAAAERCAMTCELKTDVVVTLDPG